MDRASLVHLVLVLLTCLLVFRQHVYARVMRCFEDSDCVANDVCINYSCYEIKTFDEKCSFNQECSHLNRKLVCRNGQCACQDNLIWIWSISKCRLPGYCQIEADCPGSDFKCNYTLSRCQKNNPIKSRAKKLARTSASNRCTPVFSPITLILGTLVIMYAWARACV